MTRRRGEEARESAKTKRAEARARAAKRPKAIDQTQHQVDQTQQQLESHFPDFPQTRESDVERQAELYPTPHPETQGQADARSRKGATPVGTARRGATAVKPPVPAPRLLPVANAGTEVTCDVCTLRYTVPPDGRCPNNNCPRHL